jgi:hypothetical protein
MEEEREEIKKKLGINGQLVNFFKMKNWGK